ncbi:MAG: hypothetical protein AUH05_20405 [Ktedonobacter sp. 13_2_20CM_53_11]|nr:MAG: hypothetical protein AUH05_20405 [Ktedonobacter sp. 13_2_20CM_53_11]
MSGKNFSEAQMRRYFRRGNYKGAIFLIIVGVLLIGVGFANNVQTLVLVGSAPIVLGFIIIVVLRSRPNDQEYDQWVDRQRALIASSALQKVHMDPGELVREPLSLHGVIPPASDEASPYRDNIYSKKGKDGFHRYSVNVFTYFFPAEHHIAVFSCNVDALDQRAHIEQTSHYFYTDMVGVNTKEGRLQDKKETVTLLLQAFSLRVANGDAIGIGGVVSVKVLNSKNKKSGPKVAFADNEVSKTIQALLMLLRQKKQDQLLQNQWTRPY